MLHGCEDGKTDKAQLVSQWLKDSDGIWLLVLDNADDLENFAVESRLKSSDAERSGFMTDYLPTSSQGYTLITTRDKWVGREFADPQNNLVIDPMTEEDAKRLFWTHVQSGLQDDPDNDALRELLLTLSFLPLAITQAAAFIARNRIPLRKYLDLFRENHLKLLEKDFGDSRRSFSGSNSVSRTLKTSLDLIDKETPRAIELLAVMAVLDCDGIPEELVLHQDDDDVFDTTQGLGTLLEFSLITTTQKPSTYHMHRLVQLWARSWLEMKGEKAVYEEKALRTLDERFPSGEYGTWEKCGILFPHAQVVMRYLNLADACPEIFARLSQKMASYALAIGQYAIAFERCRVAIDLQSKVYGPGHPETLKSSEILGRVLIHQGKYHEAEQIHSQNLEQMRKILGAEHPNTLSSLSNYATVLCRQGKIDVAADVYQQVLRAQQEVLGPEHPETLESFNSLALLYVRQGRLMEAESLFQQVVEERKKMLGSEHPETLSSMGSLARSLIHQGRDKEAETMFQQVLILQQKVLGLEHPETLESLNNLALLHVR